MNPSRILRYYSWNIEMTFGTTNQLNTLLYRPENTKFIPFGFGLPEFNNELSVLYSPKLGIAGKRNEAILFPFLSTLASSGMSYFIWRVHKDCHLVGILCYQTINTNIRSQGTQRTQICFGEFGQLQAEKISSINLQFGNLI